MAWVMSSPWAGLEEQFSSMCETFIPVLKFTNGSILALINFVTKKTVLLCLSCSTGHFGHLMFRQCGNMGILFEICLEFSTSLAYVRLNDKWQITSIWDIEPIWVLAHVTLKELDCGMKTFRQSIPIFIKKCFKTRVTKYFIEKYVWWSCKILQTPDVSWLYIVQQCTIITKKNLN